MISAKEKKKGIKKNIDNIVSIFDSGRTSAEKTKNIRDKIDADFKKLRARILPEIEKFILFSFLLISEKKFIRIINFEILSNVLDHMKTELIDVFI